jgi:hypothetical protein
MTAQVSSVLNAEGHGGFGGADALMSAVGFQGFGSFAAVGYAFISDTERACLHQEVRVAFIPFEYRVFRVPGEDRTSLEPDAVVPFENRTAIVPFEDRIYRVPGEARTAGNQPRKRIC